MRSGKSEGHSGGHLCFFVHRVVERQCGSPPEQGLADAGFFSLENVTELAHRGIDAYVPDSNLARELRS